MELKSIDELFNEIELVPESKLTKQYNEKEPKRNASVESNISMVPGFGQFGQYIGSPSLVNADFTEKYGLVFFDLTHDPSYRGGMNGCAYTSQLQIVNLENLNKMLVKTYNYRDIGNSPFDHRINFQEGKILKENKNNILFGIKSHELLEFYEFNVKSKKQKRVERVDLESINENQKKLEDFDKAFKELDKDALKTFVKECQMFTTIHKINEDYAIALLYDPYGDTGSRHAETKLIARGKGIIDLKSHDKKFEGNAVTQSFGIRDIVLAYNGEKIILDYSIVEDECGHTSSGSFWEDVLGITSYKIEFNPKEFDLPVNKEMNLDYLLETESEKLLSPGNINKIPIMMEGFKDKNQANYAYSIDKVQEQDKMYVVVSKIIDLGQYQKNFGSVLAIEQQIRTDVYEVKDLDDQKVKLELLSGFTTDTNDRKEYALKVDYNENTNEMKIPTPRIEINGDEMSVNYQILSNDMQEKEIQLKL